MSNNTSADGDDAASGSDDAISSDAQTDDDDSDDSGGGSSGSDDGDGGDGADEDRHGTESGSGDGGGFPDTGGAEVPELPAGPGGSSPVTLTFDDGPHPTYTPQILDMLAAHEAKAVFCVVGEQVRRHPELVRRVVDEGHALCNHSYSHDAELKTRSVETIEQEISDTAAAIAEAAPDADVAFFRQPAMYVTPEVAPVVEDAGLTVLDWTLDTRDWKRPDASTIVADILDQVQPGDVILLHDGGGDRSNTVKALAQVLIALRAAGYEPVLPTA
ncbi:polysaccharide deacetylase family protein [Phytoactinopolyspora halotolerans]|uniref:Polysaccharide deacetylase family protein n=1 Tax=Phytoactinopolyspora halotolerans TaxID=1981512 RepID=A0A6L9S832_9ACTN|nr:polysaccharide deacetylase family protein [Phytoactinopolyspora halotolerans]NEE01346.1 polysaccharide deacetylase family protein [Phytoactinopolyspora halotolerans]